jgi:dTMP kinase
MFFSFDGVDGAGKSTQIARFREWLETRGRTVVTCRDPGSTPLGEKIREILLERVDLAIDRRTEMLLFMAARAQLVEEVIRPALAAGKVIVSDRFLLANIVYQAHAGGLDADMARQVGEAAIAGIRPSVTFLLDIDPELAAQRIGRAPDRMEAYGLDYLRRVREGFLTEARARPDEIFTIDANREPDAIAADIRAIAEQRWSP